MSDFNDKASRPKARQSISHLPSSDIVTNDKENATIDITAFNSRKAASSRSDKKKSRSKSMGPGGVEALKESSGNSTKPSPLVPIKSILKPTVPLTPPQAIPSFEASRKQSIEKRAHKSPRKSAAEELLIDFSTPGPGTAEPTVLGSENLSNPFSPIAINRSPFKNSERDGDENEASKQDEAAERRKSEKQAILEQRAARRKSMANRRVSFAPEATLHTWNVIELAEDSTTSSASNSTRRQSSMTSGQSPLIDVHSRAPESDPSEPPSTPPKQVEEPSVKASPAHQRDMHQKKHRRQSSTMPPMSLSNPDDEVALSSSSPLSGSSAVDVESSPAAIEESIRSDDSDEDGDTAMTIDEVTGQTDASTESESSTRSSLDERLRQASHEAGTPGIEHDEIVDDVSMEMATESVTHAFQPFAKKAEKEKLQDLTSMQDQENINPFSPAFRKGIQAREPQPDPYQEDSQDVSMDVTTAIGGIVHQAEKKGSPKKSRRKSLAPLRRRSSIGRRRSSGDGSIEEDEMMELTTAAGSILSQQNSGNAAEESMVDEDEGMTMELTSVVGGLVNPGPSSKLTAETASTVSQQAQVDSSIMEDETMEMTAAIGGILPPIEEHTEPNTDVESTKEIEIPQAVSELLPAELRTGVKSEAKQLMEAETDAGQLNGSPFQQRTASPSKTQPRSSMLEQVLTTTASETGSPSVALKPRLSGRKSIGGRQSWTLRHAGSKQSTPVKQASRQNTPVKASSLKIATPTKQLTPQPERPDKPERTPILSNVVYRSASPKRLFRAEIKAKSSPVSAKKSSPQKKGLFSHDSETGQHTPNVILAPKPHQHLRRRSSGIGVDQEGLGSPRVAKLLDRRSSIRESIPAFVLNPKQLGGVKFDDPKQMEDEIDAEREEEERRESGRFVMEQEADMPVVEEENATLTLKEMIQSLTPKKNNKVKGRKSLHVGAARGILGKRPVELDLEDEDDDDATPKRLRTIERTQSPVKKAHLPAPPSKAETTGRMTRAKKRRSLEETAGNAQTPTVSAGSSSKSSAAANTPKPAQGRFKDAPIASRSTRPTSFEDKLDNVIGAVDAEVGQSLAEAEGEGPALVSAEEKEKIHLQDFLNMTGIHFMELNATKRRHTVAPSPSTGLKRSSSQGLEADVDASTGEEEAAATSLAGSVIAATTTLPLLELYQHATRELKSYISSGRRIIRSIEAETLEEQPPLFREYVDARPDVKMVMDNQFRNGKVNARLRSKEGWYAWREQLEDGLRSGLEAIREDMVKDEEVVAEQEEVVRGTVPGLERKFEELKREEDVLRRKVEELESEDHEALREARGRLRDVDGKLGAKQKVLVELKEEMQEKEETITAAAELKQEFLDQIAEAERVREECRGWDPRNVRDIKRRVEAIEKTSGWKISAVEEDEEESESHGPALTMRYKDELRLFFYPVAFVAPPQSVTNGRRKSRRSDTTVASAPISLTYMPAAEDAPAITAADLPTEKRFLLQFLQSHVQTLASMPKGSISPTRLLRTVSSGWDLAVRISEEARLLDLVCMCDLGIRGDEVLGLSGILILPEKKGRVDVKLQVRVSATGEDHGANAAVDVEDLKVVYGDEDVKMMLEKERGGAEIRAAVEKTLTDLKLGEGAMAAATREVLRLLMQGSGTQKEAKAKANSKASPEKDKKQKVKTPKRK